MALGKIELNANTLGNKTTSMKKDVKTHIKSIIHGEGSKDMKKRCIEAYVKTQKNLTCRIQEEQVIVIALEKGGLQSTYCFNL